MENQKKAFTLIETIVVVAIILLLFSMIVPAATSVRQKGWRTKDASKLQQIGVAAQLYAMDNNQMMVPFFTPTDRLVWQMRLKDYMDGYQHMNVHEFMVEGVVAPDSIFNAPGRSHDGGRSYGLNPQVVNARWQNRLSRVPNPSAIIHIGPIEPRNTEWMATFDGVPGWGAPMAFRYGDLTNFLYVDGHVGLHSAEQVKLYPDEGKSRFRWW